MKIEDRVAVGTGSGPGVGGGGGGGFAGEGGRGGGAGAIVGGAVAEFDRVDILVNNAGIARDAWLTKMSEEDWDETLRVNLKSRFLCCRAAARPMPEQPEGRR